MRPIPRRSRGRGPHARQGRPARPGFTLIELLTVVAILAIVSALVVPRIGNAAPTRLRGAAQVLVADLAYARNLTITSGEDPCVVVFDTAAESYSLALASDPTTPITDPIRKQPYTTAFGTGRAAHLAGVTIQSVTVGGDDTLGFQAFGNLDQGTDAVITLEADGATLTVTVDADTGEAFSG